MIPSDPPDKPNATTEPGYLTFVPAGAIQGPTARVDVIPAHNPDEVACDIAECDETPDLQFTFVEDDRSTPRVRCMQHLASAAWGILTKAGYRVDYSPRAIDWIMRR